jgi:hypothetical protein
MRAAVSPFFMQQERCNSCAAEKGAPFADGESPRVNTLH